MKKSIISAAAIAAATFGMVALSETSAHAARSDATSSYISAKVLYAITGATATNVNDGTEFSPDIKNTFGLSLALGSVVRDFRFESELALRGDQDFRNVPHDAVALFSFMLNGYYDLKFSRAIIVPYAGLGLGVAGLSPEQGGAIMRPAIQLMLGVSIPLSDSFDVDVGGKFLKPATFVSGNERVNVNEGEILAGIRYKF
ncbi:MAG: P44/Msp2 family outer membrane protein [Proteobacteria bacterium]|nr:P44/Msp2 family outer membrane protein [Pseudomonadota bacterium]